MRKLVPSFAIPETWRTSAQAQKLDEAAWRVLRQRILRRDDYTCQYCGYRSERYQIVHHIDGNPSNNDDVVYENAKLMRNHGIKSEEVVILPGTNAKMNEFEAAMGLCNLETVEENIFARRKLYLRYQKRLIEAGSVRFQKIAASKYNYSYMPVCFKTKTVRDRVYSELAGVGVHARKYFFPLTVDFQYFGDRFKSLKGLESARHISDRVLCLPLYPDLGVEVVDRICDKVSEFVR